jgi:hypothetical protein
VKYLPDFGVQPIVYVPENPTYPIVDANLIKEVSDKAIVLKQKILSLYQLASFFSKNKTKKISSGIIPNQKSNPLWINYSFNMGNLFIPDARFLWVTPSVYLEKYIIENNIETIITSGHRTAYILSV